MAYTVAPNDQGEYVHVVHSGAGIPAEIVAARAEAIRLLVARRWHRFLVDLQRLENAFSVMDHFDLVSSAADHAEIVRSAIAMVIDVRDFEDFRFAEDLSVNRGLNLKIFTDAGAAAAWLAEY